MRKSTVVRSPDLLRPPARILQSGVMSIFSAALAAAMVFSGSAGVAQAASTPPQAAIPEYALDTSWPKLPLPNKWALGLINGIFVDKNNHLWLYHSPELVPGYAKGAAASPPSGKLLCSRAGGPRVR
ncbi:MAG: hypothetical protein WDO56_36805 [Gammaproteobacteria bacterium]